MAVNIPTFNTLILLNWLGSEYLILNLHAANISKSLVEFNSSDTCEPMLHYCIRDY